MVQHKDLTGKVALITGAAKGIGFACAQLLAEHGATVVIADVQEELAREAAAELETAGLSALSCKVDVSSETSVRQMVDFILERAGQIDIVVNNAGIIDSSPMLEATVERWDRVMDINLRGSQLVTQACLPHMIARRSGKLVFMSSRAGEMGSPKVAPSYSASKGGTLALAKAYALFCAEYNITSNAVAPGYIETDMTRGRDDPNSVPMLRLGTPLDVARCVYFLSSELSSYVTGAVIDVNGGLYIR